MDNYSVENIRNTYGADESIPHFIAVYEPNQKQARVVVSGVVRWAWNTVGNESKNGLQVDLNMRDFGCELIDDPVIMSQETIKSNTRMSEYDYVGILNGHGSEYHGQAVINIATKSEYFGRVCFYDIELPYGYNPDCVIVVADVNNKVHPYVKTKNQKL